MKICWENSFLEYSCHVLYSVFHNKWHKWRPPPPKKEKKKRKDNVLGIYSRSVCSESQANVKSTHFWCLTFTSFDQLYNLTQMAMCHTYNPGMYVQGQGHSPGSKVKVTSQGKWFLVHNFKFLWPTSTCFAQLSTKRRQYEFVAHMIKVFLSKYKIYFLCIMTLMQMYTKTKQCITMFIEGQGTIENIFPGHNYYIPHTLTNYHIMLHKSPP